MCISLAMSQEDFLRAAECRGMENGDVREVHARSILLSTCEGMSKRMLIDEGANWILQGSEQEHRARTAGVQALFSLPPPPFPHLSRIFKS